MLPMALEESALENAKAQPKIRFEIRLHGPAEQQNSFVSPTYKRQ
jgi:hypothetical protein